MMEQKQEACFLTNFGINSPGSTTGGSMMILFVSASDRTSSGA